MDFALLEPINDGGIYLAQTDLFLPGRGRPQRNGRPEQGEGLLPRWDPTGEYYIFALLLESESGRALCDDIIWLTGERSYVGHAKLDELGLFEKLDRLLDDPEYAECLQGHAAVAVKAAGETLRLDECAPGFRYGYLNVDAARAAQLNWATVLPETR